MARPLPAPSNPLLGNALAACRAGLGAVILFSLCINLLTLAVPLYMLQLFDRVLTSRSTDTLIMLTIIVATAVLTLAVLEAVRSRVMVRISVWLDPALSGAILDGSVQRMVKGGGDASVQGLRDLTTVRGFLTGPGVFPIFDAPWTPIFIAVIFLFHPMLGWIATAGAVILFGLALLNELATRKPLMLSSGAAIKSLHDAEAAVRNADVIEAMGMMPNLIRRWHRDNAVMLALQAQASNRSGAITAASKLFRLALQVAMLGTGAWLALQDQITPGAMIAASILLGRALAPVEQAIGTWKSAVSARGAYQRIKALLDETPARGTTMPLPAPQGRLTVEGVGYVYPQASAPVLRNVSFELEAGELLGLIGPSAAGKTTLARLLIGNLKPQAGHVRLDKVDVADWSSDDLGQHIGYLPQDIELFSGTVRENIARMGEGDSDAVIAAARLAGVHEVILELPGGYDSEIGVGGGVLSGGQRQRIALARALYGGPRLVVLDEPNANLDQAGEEALLGAIERLKTAGVTLIVIAHRPSILRHVDKVLVLGGGTVRMFGPRDEIVPKVTGSAPNQVIDAAGQG